jgi:hypothetical protein
MRSELIYGAMTHTGNRFLLCRLVSLTTQRMHTGARVPDTINEALLRLGELSATALDGSHAEETKASTTASAPGATEPAAPVSAKERAWKLLPRHAKDAKTPAAAD